MPSEVTHHYFSAGWLRRLRRVREIKQGHFAQLLGVSQGTISKWETGEARPSSKQIERITQFFTNAPAPARDAWLSRLVKYSDRQVHVMTDADHRLLAASQPRIKEWHRDYIDVASLPLSESLPDDIAAAERWLVEHDHPTVWLTPLVVAVEGRKGGPYDIDPGLLLWERFPLSDGTWVRLITNIGEHEIPAESVQFRKNMPG
ncbi:helix-turn-helix domain-containing protein [Ensifer aridi]|uniref:helix-turn-helix domain-containing protein n=1 Tax=Ensifer aridi TaxID=1708715 RepID=UPI00358F1425